MGFIYNGDGVVEFNDGTTDQDITIHVETIAIDATRQSTKQPTLGNSAGYASVGKKDLTGRIKLLESDTATDGYKLLRDAFDANATRALTISVPDSTSGSEERKCNIILTSIPYVMHDASGSSINSMEIQFTVDGDITFTAIA